MLIISQNKKFTSENMEIGVTPKYKNLHDEIIECWEVENDYTILGKYKTEERAKEVLQEIIKEYRKTSTYKVFEMPEY